MARTILTISRPARTGTAAPTEQTGDTVNGHVVTNSGRTIITVRNADTSSHNVTFQTPGTVDGLAISDRQVAVPASSALDFAGFPPSIYGSSMNIDVDSTQLKLTARES
jgi:hypothetical protein